jgi:hypothetical protein
LQNPRSFPFEMKLDNSDLQVIHFNLFWLRTIRLWPSLLATVARGGRRGAQPVSRQFLSEVSCTYHEPILPHPSFHTHTSYPALSFLSSVVVHVLFFHREAFFAPVCFPWTARLRPDPPSQSTKLSRWLLRYDYVMSPDRLYHVAISQIPACDRLPITPCYSQTIPITWWAMTYQSQPAEWTHGPGAGSFLETDPGSCTCGYEDHLPRAGPRLFPHKRPRCAAPSQIF